MYASFFMEYEFKARASGFYGTLHGQKIYSVDDFTSVEHLIEDALKVLKTGDDAMVTFQSFDNGTTDLLRIYTKYDGNAERVTWRRNAHGYVSDTQVQEVKVGKKTVKAIVLEAIDLFKAEAAAPTA